MEPIPNVCKPLFMELERQSAGTLNYILPLQLAITVNGLLIRFFIWLSGGLLF